MTIMRRTNERHFTYDDGRPCCNEAAATTTKETATWIYVVDSTPYGSFGLARAKVYKEHPKSYSIVPYSEEQLIGWAYISKRVSKSANVFTSGTDALKAFGDKLATIRVQAEGRLQKVIAAQNKIAATLAQAEGAECVNCNTRVAHAGDDCGQCNSQTPSWKFRGVNGGGQEDG